MKRWLAAGVAAALLFCGSAGLAAEAGTGTVLPVSYRALVNRQEVLEIGQEQLKQVYQRKKFDEGQVVLFARPSEQDDYLYAAWQREGKLYDLGAVGTLPFAEEAFVHRHELNGRTVLRIDGVYAAKAPQSNYYVLDGAKVKPFLRVDGHAVESDLDRDGKKEIITTLGLRGLSKIYRELPDGSFEVADINQATGAQEVAFQMEDDLFIAKYEGGVTKKFYYRKDGLHEEK
ncbi:hypothetical protein EV586_10276 [Tumebacillus sp. BK434]|uniref:hypothetical protein n=1 Tax=Tumebacillus sp. BK434 TaxID=2512169 RepID=UPI0010527837|nr:hypothetical protein [Tumebacillus sp. BK434]TCP57632.1 hypothetical protein EV586_10276 [Tumebacillus sp. BK434]